MSRLQGIGPTLAIFACAILCPRPVIVDAQQTGTQEVEDRAVQQSSSGESQEFVRFQYIDELKQSRAAFAERRFADATEALRPALERHDLNLATRIIVLVELCRYSRYLGLLNECERYLEEAHHLLYYSDVPVFRIDGLACFKTCDEQVALLQATGRAREAMRIAQASLTFARAMSVDDANWLSLPYAKFADACNEAGEFADAEMAIRQSLDMLRGEGTDIVMGRAGGLLVRAEACLGLGHLEEARNYLTECGQILKTVGIEGDILKPAFHLTRCRLSIARDDLAGAKEDLQRALKAHTPKSNELSTYRLHVTETRARIAEAEANQVVPSATSSHREE